MGVYAPPSPIYTVFSWSPGGGPRTSCPQASLSTQIHVRAGGARVSRGSAPASTTDYTLFGHRPTLAERILVPLLARVAVAPVLLASHRVVYFLPRVELFFLPFRDKSTRYCSGGQFTGGGETKGRRLRPTTTVGERTYPYASSERTNLGPFVHQARPTF